MNIGNPVISEYHFLAGMYLDDYYPVDLVDEIRDILLYLCEQIEDLDRKSPKNVINLTHAATKGINSLIPEFLVQRSELETVARDCIATDFEFILRAYQIKLDLESAIAPRHW